MREPPKGWIEATLGDVVGFVRGVTYKKEDAKQNPVEGFVPILRATNIGQNISFQDLVYVPKRYVSKDQFLRLGDIVVAASSGSKSVVGKAALIERSWVGSFGAFCSVARPHSLVAHKFIAYVLQSQQYRAYVSDRSSGVNINNLKVGDLSDFKLLLAPANEQDRIVSEIEKQFTRLDAATIALKRAHANLKRYRASVLKAACEGRLVPTEAELAHKEGRSYESADKLLERILRERRSRWEAETLAKMVASGKRPGDDHWKRRYKDPLSPDAKKLPPLPEGWCWATFDQISWRVRSGSAATSTRAVTDYPILKSSAVRPGRVDFDDVNYLSADQSRNSDNYVRPGDILVTRLSGSLEYVGQCSVVTDLPSQNVQYPDRLFCAKLVESISGQFISYCFQYQPLRAALEETAKSTAGHQRISMTDLDAFTFPLPPLNEQRRIASELERHFSIVDKLVATVQEKSWSVARIRQSILERAFSGQLVAQNSADEPASVLLEHIRSERQSQPKPKPA